METMEAISILICALFCGISVFSILKLQKEHRILTTKINELSVFITSTGTTTSPIGELHQPTNSQVRILSQKEIISSFEMQKYQRILQKKHPFITANESRLCAFVKIGLKSHEISSITNQSVHSIEVARTRLRKKLGLTNTRKTLSNYLLEIYESNKAEAA